MTRKMIEMPGIQVLDRIPAPMLLLTTASLWGCSNVVQKTVLDDIGPLTALGLSSVIAAAALYPLGTQGIDIPCRARPFAS